MNYNINILEFNKIKIIFIRKMLKRFFPKWASNLGPLVPYARIIPLDQRCMMCDIKQY